MKAHPGEVAPEEEIVQIKQVSKASSVVFFIALTLWPELGTPAILGFAEGGSGRGELRRKGSVHSRDKRLLRGTKQTRNRSEVLE